MHRISFLLVVLTLAVAGCGGGGDSKTSSSASSSSGGGAQQVRDDAVAKGAARTAITVLEACFVDQMDYAPCAKDVATPGVTAIGTAAGYKVTATTKSGSSFVIAKGGDGTVSRTCTPAGKGGCPAVGTW